MKAITVMIPVYNAEAFIRETIDSVLCQTFPDFNILLLDDGSTDNSAAIIQTYTDPRVKYILCPHDFTGTRNKGLEMAGSKYIALIDHDDMMKPYRLQMQYDFMESHPEIAACGGYTLSFGKFARVEDKVPLEHRKILQAMLLYCPILNPTGFIRRQVLVDHNIRYEQGYSFSSDYKLWSEIGKISQLANIPEVLTLYRIHDEQTSNKFQLQCIEGGNNVKFEMLNYFLSHLKAGEELTDTIKNDFIPAINELGELGIFSDRYFFQLMYELVCSLMKQGVIEI